MELDEASAPLFKFLFQFTLSELTVFSIYIISFSSVVNLILELCISFLYLGIPSVSSLVYCREPNTSPLVRNLPVLPWVPGYGSIPSSAYWILRYRSKPSTDLLSYLDTGLNHQVLTGYINTGLYLTTLPEDLDTGLNLSMLPRYLGTRINLTVLPGYLDTDVNLHVTPRVPGYRSKPIVLPRYQDSVLNLPVFPRPLYTF